MPKRYDWFSLTFRNTLSGATRDVRFIIGQDVLAQKWAALLHELLKEKAILKKNVTLSGWPSTPRNLQYLCAELNRHIDLINKFFAEQPSDLFYHIPWHFDPISVDQKLLNLIHHDFEVLVGPTWDISRRFKIAPHSIRLSIELLNSLCHEVEACLSAQEAFKEGRAHGAVVGSLYPSKRLDFSEEDRHGAQIFFNFGDVRLHYGQMGKTHFDAFIVNDEAIDTKSMTELRYLTGQFDVNFNEDPSPEYKETLHRAFIEWLKKRNLDPCGNYGFPVVAKLDLSLFASCRPIDIMKELFVYDDVYRISVCCDGKVYSRKYKYLWNDPLLSKPPPYDWRPLLNPRVFLWTIKMFLIRNILGRAKN